MTIVAKQGKWDNAVYPWTDTTSAGYMGSIVGEINAWITAISSNASIVANGQLPVQLKGPTDSTNGGVTNGFVFEFPDTTIGVGAMGPTYPTLQVEGSETVVTGRCGDDYLDDNGNEGFGSLYPGSTVGRGHLSTKSCNGDAGYDREAIIIYDTTDGKEFIAIGMKLGAGGSDSFGIAVFKDTSGHWCFLLEDYGFCYDTVLNYWTGKTGSYDTDPEMISSVTMNAPLMLDILVPNGANNKPGFDGLIQSIWYPANEALYNGRSTSCRYANYAYLPGDTEMIVELGYNSLSVLIPVSGVGTTGGGGY